MDILVIKNALLLLSYEQYPEQLVKDVKFFIEEENIIRYSVQTSLPDDTDDFIFYSWQPYRIIELELLTTYARDLRISILLD